jgi:O-antigen/teichoic acid export membrane protein
MSGPTLATDGVELANPASERANRKLASSTPLLLANLVETVAPFLRNIALAHLLAPQEFGLAISLSVALGLIEVLTDFGLPVFAVRKPAQLSSPTAMDSLHSLTLMRAAGVGLILVLLSPLMAYVFGAGSSMWVYALLGPVALMRGFENLGVKEMMRRYVFWREAVVLAAAQAAGLVLTVAAATAGCGMASMIWGMVATAVVTLVLSHVLSPTPFRLGWDPTAIEEASAFGRPLLINGMAVALTTSDRLLVGGALGPAILALYNVAYGTATLPRSVLARFLTSAFLPLFVENRDRGRNPTPLLDMWALCLSCLAFLYGLGLGLLGDRVLGLVFGATYQPSRLFMCLAGMSVGVKFLMLLPSPAAYAAGTTRLISWSSILSALSIAPAALCLYLWRNLDLFLLTAILSEFCGLLVLARLLMREFAFTPSTVWLAIIMPFLLVGSLAVVAFVLPALDFGGWLAVCSAVLAAATIVYGLTLRSANTWSTLVSRT